MIIPDVNLLVCAYNADAPRHSSAREWWEMVCNQGQSIGLPWAVTCGFVRVMTSPGALTSPLRPGAALSAVQSWLNRSHVGVLDPGPRHLEIMTGLLDTLGVAGKLTSDAHIAAIGIEYQAEVCSNDSDFSRFPGLRWSNPLS